MSALPLAARQSEPRNPGALRQGSDGAELHFIPQLLRPTRGHSYHATYYGLMQPHVDACVYTERKTGADAGGKIGKEMSPHMQSGDNASSRR